MAKKRKRIEKKDTAREVKVVNQVTKKPIRRRSYLVALLLSIFLGYLGVDRFYVNHIGLGILKLITAGGFGIWYIIDIIMFATKNISYVKWTD